MSESPRAGFAGGERARAACIVVRSRPPFPEAQADQDGAVAVAARFERRFVRSNANDAESDVFLGNGDRSLSAALI